MSEILFLRKALENTNVRAFMRMIRHSEGTEAEDGYELLFGSTRTNRLTFNDFSTHPNRRKPYVNKAGKNIVSTAAGAYQILYGTWKGLTIKLGVNDFSPETQDLMCVALLSGANCLQRIMDGDFAYGVEKARAIWASLPGAGADQPEHTMDQVVAWYRLEGGTIAEAA
jgi:muramidase (phage lysozyme)